MNIQVGYCDDGFATRKVQIVEELTGDRAVARNVFILESIGGKKFLCPGELFITDKDKIKDRHEEEVD